MHCLEVIVKRNAEAAGREAAHAANDGDADLHIAINHADEALADEAVAPDWHGYFRGFYRGRQEG